MITVMEAITAGATSSSIRIGTSVLRGAAGWLISLIALAAGIGILYLTRDTGALAVGPRVQGALPLEQLAGQDGQPLFHMMIAWVPAGFCAGLALTALTRIGALARTLSLTVIAAVVLLLAGGISDSVAVNDPLSPHLVPQLTRGGTWIAVALFAIGTIAAGLLPARAPSYPKVKA
jgi:hypothetical protein